MPKLIKSITELKKIATDENGADCFITLAGGLVKSSKLIKYEPQFDMFYIINYVDDSTQELKSKQLADKKYTNIGEAIQKKCLFVVAN